MKNFTIVLLAILFLTSHIALSSPQINFNALLEKAERDPASLMKARQKAIELAIPVNILTNTKVMFDVKGIEDGRIVYAVITNFADPYSGGYTAFYEDAMNLFDPSRSRIDYGNGVISDGTNGMYDPVISSPRGLTKFLMVPDWTFDRVYLFNYDNGDLVDTAFISHASPQLQSPKHALKMPNGQFVVVSDQISDLVQKFDTNGAYVNYFAPSTGINTAILDNIRGIRFLPDKSLLVTVASGASQNTIQKFDTGGVHTGSFISANLNSPFDILLRANDILITNSSGTAKINRFANDGTFISTFYGVATFNFPQQMYQLPDTRILVAAFSSPSGLVVLDSSGSYISMMTSVTGLRGVHSMGNGHYMVTNATGVHEIDSATGNLIRTVVTGANYQYVSLYNSDNLVSLGNQQNFIPERYELFTNYPNPFNPSTQIKFSIPENANVKLTVYDVTGRVISKLIDGHVNAGTYEATFSADGLNSGVYFYRLEANDFSENKKMIFLK